MPHLDVATAIFATAVVALALAVPTIGLALREKTYRGAWHWAAGLLCAFAGLFVLALRGTMPDEVVVLAGNLFTLGYSDLVVRGLKAFLGERQRTVLDIATLVVTAAALQLFLSAWPSTPARVAVFSAATVFLSLRTLVVIARGFPKVMPGRDLLLLVTVSAFSAWHVTRVIVNLLPGHLAARVSGSAAYQVMTFLVGIASNIVISTSLIVAMTRRMEVALDGAEKEVRTLSGLLPICANCKRIRAETGTWISVESYLSRRADLQLTHGLCPECVKTLYPQVADRLEEEKKGR